jgi:UMF1 family MFS transporter
MASAPILGAYADAHAAKKTLLALTTAGCVLFTAALALTGRGDVALACVLVAASSYFFGSGESLIAAFLPEIAREETLGRISGWGWSLGYIGGLVSLGASLAYVSAAQARSVPATEFVPGTMLITAAIFTAASLPTFVFLRERSVVLNALGTTIAGTAFSRLAHTLRHAHRYADLRRFLICLVFYQAGVQAVVALAAIYAQQAMGFSTRDTLLLVLVVNVTAALGAFFFGHVQDRLGHVRTIVVTLIGWLITVIVAWAAKDAPLFWLAANLAGLCLGSSQSAGRALVGYLSPPARTAEFFGLWSLAVKLSSILGPVTYGAVTWVSGGDHRTAILVTGVYFIAGLAIIAGVDAARGRRAAISN